MHILKIDYIRFIAPFCTNLALFSRPYPVYLIFSLFDFFFTKKYEKVDWLVLYSALFIIAFSLLHAFYSDTFSFSYLVAYLAPLFILNLYRGMKLSIIHEISKVLTLALLLIAIFQSVLPGNPINDLINLVFTNNYDRGIGYRGVSGIFPEPSQFGAYFFSVLSIYFVTSKNKKIIYFFFIALAFLYLNRSASFLLPLILFCFIYALRKFPLKLFLLFFILIFFSKDILWLLQNIEIRAFEPIQNLFEIYVSSDGLDRYDYASIVGGRRALQNLAAIEMLVNNPFGYGLGSVDSKYFTDFTNAGYDQYLNKYSAIQNDPRYLYDLNQVIKPFSYLLQITYDFGYIFLLPIFFFVFNLLKFVNVKENINFSLLCTSLFQIAAFSKLSLYAPWITIGFLISYSNKREE